MPKVAVIGAGLIGRAWAIVFGRGGWSVAVTDSSAAALAAAPGRLRTALDDLAEHGLVTDAAATAARIAIVSTIPEAAADADFIQECGPETLADKIAIFRALDAAAPRRAILASSSSAIAASRYTKDLKGRARCLVAHPVNPPHLVPIVELCPAPWTSAKTVGAARRTYEEIGQVPILVRKEIEGFILNRLQGALLAEAFRLVGAGYVSAADLDKTIKDGLGLRWSFMGPIETIELNAPGGIADYCARYTGFYKRLQADPAPPSAYQPANTARIIRSWGKPLAAERHAAKTRWRDRRLAALVAHKRAQKSFA
jgi:3-hydroxyacyl-CoA dehydrogenase